MCEQLHQAFMFTVEFSKALKSADIVTDQSVEVEFEPGQKTNLGSFKAVDEEKFKALSDATILDWRAKGFLHTIYFHMQSLNNWDLMVVQAAAAKAKT